MSIVPHKALTEGFAMVGACCLAGWLLDDADYLADCLVNYFRYMVDRREQPKKALWGTNVNDRPCHLGLRRGLDCGTVSAKVISLVYLD